MHVSDVASNIRHALPARVAATRSPSAKRCCDIKERSDLPPDNEVPRGDLAPVLRRRNVNERSQPPAPASAAAATAAPISLFALRSTTTARQILLATS